MKMRIPFKHEIIKDGNNYLFHILVPSEKYKLMYDVYIYFILKSSEKTSNLLTDYDIQIYSNSPAFTFNYAYVANQKDLLYPPLKNKISSIALSQPPSIRNPSMLLGFEKSLYFASLYIIEKKLHLQKNADGDLSKIDITKISSKTTSDEEILIKYKKLNVVQAKKAKDDRYKKMVRYVKKRTRQQIDKAVREKAGILQRKIKRKTKRNKKIRAKKHLRIVKKK